MTHIEITLVREEPRRAVAVSIAGASIEPVIREGRVDREFLAVLLARAVDRLADDFERDEA